MSVVTQLQIPTEAELKSYQMIAVVASNNPYWRKLGGSGTNEQVVATILSVMLLARELGISPMQSVSGGINNIQGKFEISARLMNQLIRRHGHTLHIKESNDQYCIITTKRKDTGEVRTVEYHIEEAARAGLIKDAGGWKKCPKDMLFARCISRLARQVYPDCIGGCYVEGELQETIQGKVVESVEMPSPQEIENIEEIEEETILKLPAGINEDRVEDYIKSIMAMGNSTANRIKKRASENIDGFLGAFKMWEAKNYPHPNEELILQESI